MNTQTHEINGRKLEVPADMKVFHGMYDFIEYRGFEINTFEFGTGFGVIGHDMVDTVEVPTLKAARAFINSRVRT